MYVLAFSFLPFQLYKRNDFLNLRNGAAVCVIQKNKPMNKEEKDIIETGVPVSNDEVKMPLQAEGGEKAIERLQDDIIRNDTIPETSKDTPGSNGAFPVGAFDTSKD